MPKVDDRPTFRVSKWSIKDLDSKKLEEWMNEEPDYYTDATIREDDTIIFVLYLSRRFRRMSRSKTPAKTTKKKTVKKEATKK